MSTTPQKIGPTSARVDAGVHAAEPIAIVGMACRFPGANGPSELWELLTHGRNAMREVPKDRFDIDAVVAACRAEGKSFSRIGGFLEGAGGFDTDYFGLSPREAGRMDPQHRLALELSAEALDDAFLNREELGANVTGVYMGMWSSDWECHEYADRKRPDVYSLTGSARCVLSGRVSFAFDLRGPSLTVDTGCSSSLLAAHLACRSLWAGEASLAVVGGLNLVLDPWQAIAFAEGNMGAPDGQCKAFSKHANGLVRSDGGAVVVLMPLSTAMARGSRVYAVIRGSGVSNDGSSNGLLSTPSEVGQELAIRAAYRSAGLSPNDVQYVEAHGTGTRAGDPVELRALAAVMETRPKADPCLLGSIKSNIGHTEGAAGLAGLIKAALAIRNRTIPKTLHCEEPTELVDWSKINLTLAQQTQPWPNGTARAGVSSFGISGTNVHMVLEEVPGPVAAPAPEDRDELLVLSAVHSSALRANAQAMAELLAKPAEESGSLRAICYSASVGRRHHDHRLSVVGGTRETLKAALESFVRGEEHAALTLQRRRSGLGAPVFVFSGQGRQWPGMGKALFESEPVFRASFEACNEALSHYVDWSLLDELSRRDSEKWPFSVIQPSIFAIQVALCALLRSWGVEPGLVVGHSMGEVAAAHVAGIINLDDAAHIIARRSQNLQDLAGRGGMLAVELSLEDAEALIARHADVVSVAANNGPTTSVLSGDRKALQEIATHLERRDVYCRQVEVDAAAHSPQLEPLLAAFERDIARVRPNVNAPIPIVSTVTGELLDPGAFTAAYWRRNQREPVRFATAARTAIQRGHGLFVEIGPHPTLLGPLQQILSASKQVGVTVSSLKREGSERAALLETLGQLHAVGQPVSFGGLYPERPPFVALPPYAWQRDAYELLPERAPGARSGTKQANGAGEDAVLGVPIRSPLQTRAHLWQVSLSPTDSTYLADHRVQGAAILPGAAYVSMALAAAEQVFGTEQVVVEDLEFGTALVLPPDATTQLDVAVSIENPELAQIAFYTSTPAMPGTPAQWTRHAWGRARVREAASTSTDVRLDSKATATRCEPGEVAELYQNASARGIDYGPAFQGVEEVWNGDGEVLVKATLPSTVLWRTGAHPIHPALLDACWQALAGRISSGASKGLYLPIGVGRVRRHRALGTRVWAHVRLKSALDADLIEADIQIFDDDGALAFETEGIKVRKVDSRGADAAVEDGLYDLAWVSQPLASDPKPSSLAGQKWLVLADRRHRVGVDLCALLQRAGAECRVAYAQQGGSGSGDRITSPESTVIDAADPAAIEAWVARETGAAPFAGVIDLWALDAVPLEEATSASLDDAQLLGVVGATHVFQALSRRDAQKTKLWLITAGGDAVTPGEAIQVAQAPLWGFGRVLRNEAPVPQTLNLDLGPLGEDAALRLTELEGFVRELGREAVAEVALRGGERWVRQLSRVPRAVRAHEDGKSRADAHANYWLQLRAEGVLDNLYLREIERVSPGPGELEVEITHAGLNFIDVMKALGIYPEKSRWLGGEGVGIVRAIGPGVEGFTLGQRVVLVVHGGTGTFARFVRCDAALTAPCPEGLDSAEAAAIPLVYMTAYYAMIHLGRLSAGERVLIHSGAGGVGLAAIDLARRAGAEIFATAGSEEKRQFLRDRGVQHVFDSRQTAFAAEIMKATNGEGIDMVLNSLAGEMIPLSLGLLRDDGRFFEIGKRDIYDDMPLGLGAFRRALSLAHIDMLGLLRNKPALGGRMLREVLDLAGRNELTRSPLTKYSIAQAAEAFRFMAQAKHIGKIVLESLDAQEVPARVEPRPDAPLAKADATYLVTGGLGGLGLLVADWLVAQGARFLVLTGRSAPSEAARSSIARFEEQGVKVSVVACDVGDRQAVTGLVDYIKSELPPLRGVVHGAAVLADGLARELTPEKYRTAMWPKMHGAFNLHAATEGVPLDFFVLFSSAASILGSPGQANYAAGNTFMDALAHHRRARGLTALSINWGPWSESGIAVRPDRAGRLFHRGMGGIPDREGIRLLDHLVRTDRAQASVLPGADFKAWVGFYPAAAKGLLEALLREGGAEALSAREESSARAAILGAGPDEQLAVTEAYATELIRRVLRIPATKTLDPELPLSRFGVDSLMALELNNRLEADLGVRVQLSRILLSEGLRKFSSEVLKLVVAGSAGSLPPPPKRPVAGAGFGSVIEAADSSDGDVLPDDYFSADAGR